MLPAASLGAAVAIGRRLSGAAPTARAIACRLALALVPIGVAMWSAHFLFHFATGIGTALPVAQRALADLGAAWVGAPDWSHAAAMRSPGWLTGVELLLLDAGLLLEPGGRLALGARPERRPRRGAPWRCISRGRRWPSRCGAGAWIVFQPMQMRGMVH